MAARAAAAARRGGDEDDDDVVSEEEAYTTLGPFLTLGMVQPEEVAAALARPRAQRNTALQVLMARAFERRQELRKICAECGSQEGKLKICSKCGNCWYCSRECQLANWASVHRKTCSALKIARVCREEQGVRASVQEEFERMYMEGLRGKTIMQWPPRHIPQTWPEFFKVRGLIMDDHNDALGSYNLLVSELLHEGLTVALAAQRLGLLPEAPVDRPFRLHILGAVESEECARLHLSMGELGRLFRPHYYKGGLEVSLFGPQLGGSTAFAVPLDEEAAPGVMVAKRHGLYHEWARANEGDAAARPDLVVAFNSGAHTRNDHEHVDGSVWMPTLAHLLAEGVPTVMTGYDHLEGEKLAELLASGDIGGGMRAHVAFGPELNPMRSLVLEESEPPEAHRYAAMMMEHDGANMTPTQRAEILERIPLDISTCNRTSGNSRVWVGFKGVAAATDVGGGGAKAET